ncbi:IS481 family transposase [Candidatus Poriferisodalis sp.]
MSRNRLVIMAVVVEGRTHADVAAQYGLSRSWVTKLVARWRAEGEAAFEPRSRRPRSSPARVPDAVTDLVVGLRIELAAQGLDAGPATIAWHLERRHQIMVSPSTIRRRLVAAGLVTPEPAKRPRSSYVRFAADLPNETWQTDFTHTRLADRAPAEILTWLDDCSRYALSVTAHRRVSGPAVADTFTKAADQHGCPASVLSDNAMVYTTRYAGGRGGKNALETLLADLGVAQKHSRPNHPRTCGKVERFQQTLKKWLAARPPAHSVDQLQAHLDDFTDEYNNRRPHRSLGRSTPAVAYRRLPKATPQPHNSPTHHRVRTDRVDKTGSVTLRHNGRLHHIGIGRSHTGTPVILLIAGLNIRVIDHDTGELIRALTLNPQRDYQPQN